ncbi:MAG: hypothetical protein PHQ11_16680 [Paludibacter sp.]|nr:hypothetical protein [Paludibacter sp.]
MRLLKPDATTDGKIIFNFESKGEVITIIKEVTDYKKNTLLSAKKDAVSEAKSKIKEKVDKKAKRETALSALAAAGISEEAIDMEVVLEK